VSHGDGSASPNEAPSELGRQEAALLALGEALRAQGYQFTTVTPESHRRVNARPESHEAHGARDVFGWSRSFTPGLLPGPLLALLEAAGALEQREDGRLRSRVRCSTLGRGLYVHSAWPTENPDAVFFGPDTYRFCALLARLPGTFRRGVDMGCGSGAGLLSLDGRVEQAVLADVNDASLRYEELGPDVFGEELEKPPYRDVERIAVVALVARRA
jgi:hypothetical protein